MTQAVGCFSWHTALSVQARSRTCSKALCVFESNQTWERRVLLLCGEFPKTANSELLPP